MENAATSSAFTSWMISLPFWSHNFDVINKYADHWAVEACFCHKDALICVYLRQAKLLQKEVWEPFVPEAWRLFEAV